MAIELLDVTLTRDMPITLRMPKRSPSSELDRHCGLRLKAVREVLDERGPIRQESFAAKLGVERTALANWEGGRMPEIRAMIRMVQIFDVSLEWIYLGRPARLDYDLADRLIRRASELGAAVGSAVAEFPMQQPPFVSADGENFRRGTVPTAKSLKYLNEAGNSLPLGKRRNAPE